MCRGLHKAAAARREREIRGHPGIEIRGPSQRSGSGGAPSVTGSGWDRSMGAHEGRLALYSLGVIVAVYVVELLVLANAGEATFDRIFVLDATWLSKPWTLITSVFAHASTGHLLVNGIVLFFFGPLLERRVGSRRFLALLIIGGMLAGLTQVTFYSTFLGSAKGVVGISGSLMAIMGALAVLGPRLTVLIFFVIPAPLWALTAGYAALDALGLFAQGSNVAHLAHLTGLVVGLAWGKRLRDQGFKFPGRQGHLSLGQRSGW